MRRETQTMVEVTGGSGSHAGQPIAVGGAPLAQAAGALILVHGRGGRAVEILGLAELVGPPQTAWLAPQAAGHTWYPHRFVEPAEVNEPNLGSALSALGDVVNRVAQPGCRRDIWRWSASRRVPVLRSSSPAVVHNGSEPSSASAAA
jgi:hypothetical protein